VSKEPKETIELFEALVIRSSSKNAEKRHIERYGEDYRYNLKNVVYESENYHKEDQVCCFAFNN
jgi:hypothetical protein